MIILTKMESFKSDGFLSYKFGEKSMQHKTNCIFTGAMKKYLTPVSAFQVYHVVRYSALVMTGIVFTKTHLSQADIGRWETFLLIAGAVTFFWLNGFLKALLLTGISDEQKNTTSPAVFTSFIIISVLSIFSAGFLLFTAPLLSHFVLNGNGIPFMELILFFIVIGVPSNMIEYLYLLKKQNQQIVGYAFLSFSFQLICVLIPAILGLGMRMVVIGLLVSMAARYIWLLVVLFRNYPVRFSTAFARKYAALAWPLALAALLSGSAQYVDGFIITSRFSQDVFAVFQYGAREFPLAVLLANALSNSMLPAFANRNLLFDTLAILKNNSRRLMHFLFPLTAVLLILSHPVFPILFNPAFSASSTIFNVYMLLIISRLIFPQTILTGMQYTRDIMLASFFELIINVVFSLLLVKWLGIAGVAAGTVIACFFEKAVLVKMVKNRLGISSSDYIPWNLLYLYSAGILIVFILSEIIF